MRGRHRGPRPGCFVCGEHGHFAIDCPQAGKTAAASTPATTETPNVEEAAGGPAAPKIDASRDAEALASLASYIREKGPMPTSSMHIFMKAKPEYSGQFKSRLISVLHGKHNHEIVLYVPSTSKDANKTWIYVEDALSPEIRALVSHASALERTLALLKKQKNSLASPASAEAPIPKPEPALMQAAQQKVQALLSRVAALEKISSELDERLVALRPVATTGYAVSANPAAYATSAFVPSSTQTPAALVASSAPKAKVTSQAAAPSTEPRFLSQAWQVVSAWSVAGQSTSILLSNRVVKRRILLDCGGMGTEGSEADVVLITHGHVDHFGGMFVHARSRQSPAKYLVPVEMVPGLVAAKQAYELLDGHALGMEIVPVSPGSVFNLGKGLIVEAVKTAHRVPSVGYLISRQERQTKPEFADLPDAEKQALGKAGVEMHEFVTILQVAYSGDCTAEAMDSRLLSAPLCIVEATFFGLGPKDGAAAAKEHAHVLLSELSARVKSVPDVGQQLLLCHFSARYDASTIVRECTQAEFWGRPVALALRAFGVSRRGRALDDAVWTTR